MTFRARVLTFVATGAIAFHIADDAFVQPEPGASARDHLVGGLVPLALLAAGALSLPRLRAGARAAVELLFGLFGVVAGVEAAYYTLHGGPSGDDYTGMSSALAGLALLGVGCATLWMTRRVNDSLRRRYLRRALVAAASLVFTFTILFPAALGYVFTHTARAHVPTPRLGAAHENVSFETDDGLTLKGWFVPSQNGATVVVFPGRSGPQQQTRMLVRNGYGVLLFDRRGEGASEGDPNMFGWHGERDLHAAVDYLRGRDDVDAARIGGIGLSVGGEMLIRAAAQSTAFKAIVAEGASGQSVRDDFANDQLGDVLATSVITLATAVFADDLPPHSLKSDVARIAPRAVFLIYAENGQGGTEKGPNLGFYAAAGQPKQLWEVPDGQHVAGITTRPKEYERRVIGFLDRELR